MKKIEFIHLDTHIKRIHIYPFDLDESADQMAMKGILGTLFQKGEPIFFLCWREDDFLSHPDRLKLRESIPEYFIENGKYALIEKGDEERHACCAMLPLNDSTLDCILNLWRYYQSLDFFTPSEELRWERLVLQARKSFKKHFNFGVETNHWNFICTKGYDGDMLIVTYKQNTKLPDLKGIVQSFGGEDEERYDIGNYRSYFEAFFSFSLDENKD